MNPELSARIRKMGASHPCEYRALRVEGGFVDSVEWGALRTHRQLLVFQGVVTAALSTAAGVLLVWKPAQGALTLTLLLMALFITEGIFRIATSLLRMRKQEEQRLAAALEALRILGTVRDANRSRA